MSNSREIALKILMRIEEGAYSNLILDSELSRHELSDLDKSYITRVIYGVVTYKLTLDYIIKKNSKIRLKKISQSILNILRLGIFEIYYMDKINILLKVHFIKFLFYYFRYVSECLFESNCKKI